METLKLLQEYFSTAVFTGRCLVFVSEDWRVELTEHKNTDYSRPGDDDVSVIRVRIYRKTVNGELLSAHHEDFQIASLNQLAGEIEKYIQSAVGRNIRENP
jgi:hypothetical protein